MKTEIRSKNGWYFAVIPRQRGLGKALVKFLGTKNRDEADKLAKLADLEQMALAEKAGAIGLDVWTRLLAGRRVRVRDAVQEYEHHRTVIGMRDPTLAQDDFTLDKFLRLTGLGNQPIAAIETKHVADYVNQIGNYKLSSREKWLSIINKFLDWCVEKRWLVTNPALDVAVRLDGLTQEQMISVPRPAFTEGEVTMLLSVIPKTDYWHGAVLFASTYGLRLATVAELEETNIVANQLRVYATKGRRVVNEPLTDDLLEWLELWRTVRPASDLPHLFPAQAAMDKGNLSKIFVRLCRKHGIEAKSFHGLRRTAVARKWNGALADLGSVQARALAKLVAENGFRAVQRMLSHAPGSDVTESYMPR